MKKRTYKIVPIFQRHCFRT